LLAQLDAKVAEVSITGLLARKRNRPSLVSRDDSMMDATPGAGVKVQTVYWSTRRWKPR
jgi:hypothetical protein